MEEKGYIEVKIEGVIANKPNERLRYVYFTNIITSKKKENSFEHFVLKQRPCIQDYASFIQRTEYLSGDSVGKRNIYIF